MLAKRTPRRAARQYDRTANHPPADPRKPPPNAQPRSHSTGGRKDHETAHEGDTPKTG